MATSKTEKKSNLAKMDFLKSLTLLQFIGSRGRSRQPQQAQPQATGQGGSSINPITVNVNLGREKDWATIIFILTAYFIWLIDLSPGGIFGKPYKGFIFDAIVLTKVNWIGVGTSLIVTLFLLADVFMSLKKRGEDESFRYVIEMGLIALINGSTLAAYYWQAFTNPVLNISFLAVGIFTIGYLLYKKGLASVHGADLITYWTMVLTYSFFWTIWNWSSNYKAIIHMAFITLFMLLYLRKKEDINLNKLYLFTAIFLILDFYAYSYDLTIPFTKLSFPILVILTSFYCVFFTKSTFALINGILWSLAFVLLWVLPSPAYAQEIGVDFQERQSGGFINELIDPLAKAWEAFNLKITGRLDVATGGLYSAQVEKNQFEPLGVFLDKVRAAQPKFYPDEPVTIWSSIKSRTLSDPVVVRFNCFRYGKDNSRIGIRDDKIGSVNLNEGKLIPDRPFTVFTLEEKDVECTFNKDKFQPGTNPVTISAQYNFVTSAYQEVRFIDRARYQAMIKENLDSLKEFGITDKNPKTIYTNGPVEIKEIIQNPIPVDLESQVLPNLGVTLTNRDKIMDKQGKTVGQWQGKILNIEELAIVVPKGIKIEGAGCNPVPFTDYKKEDCLNSCRKTCTETCEEYDKDKQKDVKDRCLTNCADKGPKSEITRKCDNECNILFKDEEGLTDYSGYQLDTQFIKKLPVERRKTVYEDIGRFTQFGCRLTLTPDVLEEGVGITRKYIRVRAKYNYLLENTYSVSVEAIPTPTELDYEPFEDAPEYPKFKRPQTDFIPSNIDLDGYFRSKNSELAGIGQCLRDTEKEKNVPILVILSIANLESDKSGGQWSTLSGLAQVNYNLFGIKCSTNYINNICTFTDKRECCKGWSKTKADIIYEPNAPNVYKAYKNNCESIRDFAKLIAENPRYKIAMDFNKNPEEMIKKIGEAGYATDPTWASKVIARMNIIKNDILKAGAVIS